MRTVCLTIFCFLGSCVYGQQAIEGVYRASEVPTETTVTAQNGNQYWLAEMLAFDLDEVSLFAQDNGNNDFSLNLRFLSDGPSVGSLVGSLDQPRPDYVLVVANQAYVNYFYGGGNDQLSLFFQISGGENAERIGDYFNTPVFYRHHPGHRLLVNFIPARDVFSLEDDIEVYFSMKNIGEDAIAFSAIPVGNFHFSARLILDTVAQKSPLTMSEIFTERTLEPGETYTNRVNLQDWLEINEVGRYSVYGSYRVLFKEPGQGLREPVIWSDYVTDDFTVIVDGD